MDRLDASAAAASLAHFFATLTPRSLTGIDAFYAEQARFKDPFNEVTGRSAIIRIFEHMFASVDAPRFVVITRIAQGRQAMLGWNFHLRLRGRMIVIRGVSHVCFDDDWKVEMHRDYWDAAEELYARLAVVGGLMRLLRRKLSAPIP